MNTEVGFELAKLLTEKNVIFKEAKKIYNHPDYSNNNELLNGSIISNAEGDLYDCYLAAPTITDVVMWLYEEHGIWIEVRRVSNFDEIRFQSYIDEKPLVGDLGGYLSQDLPTEAYKAAIEYTLTKLI